MSDTKTLYDEDFVLWSKQQAEALRAAARGANNQPIDWENVAEEIDSLGRSDKRELASQIRRIIEHLLKLEHSPATEPRRTRFARLADHPLAQLVADHGMPAALAAEVRDVFASTERWNELNEIYRDHIRTTIPEK